MLKKIGFLFAKLSCADSTMNSKNMALKKKTRNAGFTVVELIAVLAIIVILATFIIPALLKGREMGRSARCVANLKQLAQAVRMYVDEDAQGRFPGYSGDWRVFKNLMPLLLPYLGQTTPAAYEEGELKVFRCPSNNNKEVLSNRVDTFGNQIDYEYNGQINNFVAQTKVANAEWVSLLYDWPIDPAPPTENIHRGGCNIAFYDGHVQWYSRQQMMSPHAPKYDPLRDYQNWGLN
jgi:prepilin-type processing-associated H-X9-DG protein/prepilin-type N-terminal cleavage/methylation domain-containing protein